MYRSSRTVRGGGGEDVMEKYYATECLAASSRARMWPSTWWWIREEEIGRIFSKNPSEEFRHRFDCSNFCVGHRQIVRCLRIFFWRSCLLDCICYSCSLGYLQNSEYCSGEVALFSIVSFGLECAVFLGACIILHDSMKRCCCCGSFLEEEGNVRWCTIS
jgi:hypothetical protein